MRDLAVLFLHLLATVARLAGPGGARAVVAESVLVKQQLLILNRPRKRSPTSASLIASSKACARCSSARAAGPFRHRPETLHALTPPSSDDRAETSPAVLIIDGAEEAGRPKGPNQEVIAAVVDMKRRNPTWGCPR